MFSDFKNEKKKTTIYKLYKLIATKKYSNDFFLKRNYVNTILKAVSYAYMSK
jgi:hypothetical protein